MKTKCTKPFPSLIFSSLSALIFVQEIFVQVKVFKGTEVISMCQKRVDETSLILYRGRGVQGDQDKVCPYPGRPNLVIRWSVTYEITYLENEYIKIKVLPDFGGRLLSAIYKAKGHELFRANSVIEPDLIGTLAAWVSGGIEWCFPLYDRTTTMLKSDYRPVNSGDGSAAV